MKRIIISLFLLLSLILALASCGDTPKIEISEDGYEQSDTLRFALLYLS